MTPDDKKAFNLELAAAMIFIGSIILSVYLSYLKKTTQETSLNKKIDEANLCNSIIAFIAVCLFAIVSIYNYQRAKEKGENLSPYTIRLIANAFSIITFLINIKAAFFANKNDGDLGTGGFI